MLLIHPYSLSTQFTRVLLESSAFHSRPLALSFYCVSIPLITSSTVTSCGLCAPA